MIPGARRRALWAVAVATLALAAPAGAQELILRPFPSAATSFEQPQFVTSPPGDTHRVFVVEGPGTIELVKDGGTPRPFLDITDTVRFGSDWNGYCSECGLLSVAFAPDYANSGLFYVQYTRASEVEGEDHYLVTEEFRRDPDDPDRADPDYRRIVLEVPHLETSHHNGGQLQFGPDRYLYISTGDGGGKGDPFANAQDPSTLLGKLLRIDPTPAPNAPGAYATPPDNPFAGASPGADEIYSYGLRNPWRFSFDRLTGDLTIGDVGEVDWEEVDFRSRGRGLGANFGWNCFEGNHPFVNAPASCAQTPQDYVPPAFEYPHLPGSSIPSAAVIGGYVVRDGALPDLLGRYVFADSYQTLGGTLHAATLSESGADEVEDLGLAASFPISFGEDACAHLYLGVFAGTVYRLEPEDGSFPCDPQDPVDSAPAQTASLTLGLKRAFGKIRPGRSARAKARHKRKRRR